MSVVLAFLDGKKIAAAVLDMAVCVGDLCARDVEVVHVHDGTPETLETPETLAEKAGLTVRILDPPPGQALVAALSERRTRAAAIGARSTPDGRQPLGATARYVLGLASKPLFVVPPGASIPDRLERILIPLEGDAASALPVVTAAASLLGPSVELVVLHVFTATTLPAMVDRPEYDLDIVGSEFLTRHFPFANRIILRPGQVDRRVHEVVREFDVGLVALVWKQRMEKNKAPIVRAVLGSSPVPTLLIPLGMGEVVEEI